ncbi:MAG: tetratricopeptide repeat protein [Polyangia bacterium]|jgi:Flp pilus assembly protein TadD
MWCAATFALIVFTSGVALATQEESAVARETFVVEPFKNSSGFRALDHLEAGLPALVAERLGHLAPLKFVGGETLFGHAATVTPRWTVSGEFARRADWKIAVTVRIKRSGRPFASAEATRVAGTDAAAVAVEAALAAFRKLLGDRVPAAKPSLSQRFARDPYAFVLYGRGVATYLGLAGRHRSQDEAIKILGRSLVIDPKVPETRRFLGAIHLENGRPGHARAMWSVAVEARPDYLAALAGLAALDRSEGSAAARDRYARLVELDPGDLDVRRAYGEVLAEAGQLAQAQAELNRVLQASPDDVRARRALALVLASRRAGPELVGDLEEVVRLQPDSVDARMDLGAAYLGVGKRSEAEAVYDEVLRRRPRSAAALKLCGDLARARGDLKKATSLFGRLRWIAPNDPRPAFLLGTSFYQAGNLNAAERWFIEAAKVPGMLGEAYGNLGVIALLRGQPKEAQWFLNRAAKRRPQRALLRYNYALALYTNNRPEDALNQLHVAQALEPNDAATQFFTGVVALRVGLLPEAERCFREALRLDPQNEDARHNLALLEPLVRPTREERLSLGESAMAPPPRVEIEKGPWRSSDRSEP